MHAALLKQVKVHPDVVENPCIGRQLYLTHSCAAVQKHVIALELLEEDCGIFAYISIWPQYSCSAAKSLHQEGCITLKSSADERCATKLLCSQFNAGFKTQSLTHYLQDQCMMTELTSE